MNSQVTNPLDSSKTLGVKEINVRLRQLDSVQGILRVKKRT